VFFNSILYDLLIMFIVNDRSGPKRVRYLFEPDGVMVPVPVLAHDIDIYYQWCERHRMVDETTGELHNCMRGSHGQECELGTAFEVPGEHWREFYVATASGEVLEKWVGILRYFLPLSHPDQVRCYLMWRSPESDSVATYEPEMPSGGCFWFNPDNSPNDDCSFRMLKVEGKLEFPGGEERRTRIVKRILGIR
jgi:hypothetical protein